MYARRHVAASALGALLAAGVFFLTLDHMLTAERWGWIPLAAVAFGALMAGLSTVLVRLDARQRTVRNLVFVHAAAAFGGVMTAAWALTSTLDHLEWQEMTVYTLLGLVVLALVWLITRKDIRGERPGELFP